MVNKNVEKDHVIGESPSDKLRHNFRLGDIAWVKLNGSSWWPAQVIDESCVGSKPKKKDNHDCLVRLYGTWHHLCVDLWKYNSEFELMLKQENKSAREVFREVLEKKLSCVNSPSDYDEEADHSKDGSTNRTAKKNSARKVSKQEGLKQQYNEEEDQDVRSSATTGVTARKRKGGRVRQSSSTHDAVDKASSASSAVGLRNKRQKHAAQSASVGRREGLRRSGHSDAKQYLDAADDSMLNEISAPHMEIKAMVRDILFKDIIDRQRDAEMTYVKEVINAICNAKDIIDRQCDAEMTYVKEVINAICNAKDIIDRQRDAEMTYVKCGRGVKQSGSGVEDESSNVTERGRDEATSSPASRKGSTDTSHGTEAMVKTTPGNFSARQVRQMRIIQSLGLVHPSKYPVGWNREAAATYQRL